MLTFILSCFVLLAVTSSSEAIHTVSSLNMTSYLGRWYQVYADFIVMETYERNSVCVTADYGKRKDGKMSVLNSGRIKKPDGDLSQITGYAYATNPKEPGQLTLHFDSVPFDGSYWIVKLGPISEGQYQYSVVTDGNKKLQMFVLARDVEAYYKNYNDEVQEFLKENGFTHFWNKPVKTYQSADCKYVPKPVTAYQSLKEFLSKK